jgi:hypothetical protein
MASWCSPCLRCAIPEVTSLSAVPVSVMLSRGSVTIRPYSRMKLTYAGVWQHCALLHMPELAPFVSLSLLSYSLLLSSFLAHFPKVVLCDLRPVCVYMYPPPPHQDLNAWINLYETWYVYHGTWSHLNGGLHKSLPSVCMSICMSLLSLLGNGSVKCVPHNVARQRLGKHVPAATNTRDNRRIVGRVIFYAVRVLLKESLWVSLCLPLSLLGNNSIKTFPGQRRIVGGVVFYPVHVSKESRWLVLPRASCFLFLWLFF